MRPPFVMKNVIILFLAPILALGLFFLTRDFTGLTASVLDLSELQKIEENKWGVAYKTQNQLFELFGSDKAKQGENLIFELIYNPKKVALFAEQSSGFDFKILKNNTGSLKIQLNSLNTLKVDEGWFQLPFSGEENQLILAEASLRTGKNNLILLSIGSLNSQEEHSFLP